MHIIAYTMVNVNLIYLLNPRTLLKKKITYIYLVHQVSLSTLSMKRQMIFMDDGVPKGGRVDTGRSPLNFGFLLQIPKLWQRCTVRKAKSNTLQKRNKVLLVEWGILSACLGLLNDHTA